MVDVMENWQSEYLQFFLYIFATVWLVQMGSGESKEPGKEGTETDQEQRVGGTRATDSPAWARAGGWRTTLFSRSLGLLMGGLFLLTWAASAVTGWVAFNSEQLGAAAGPGDLPGLPGRGRLLEPELPELAVGDARRRVDGDLRRLPAAARVAGVQAGGRRRTPTPAQTG